MPERERERESKTFANLTFSLLERGDPSGYASKVIEPDRIKLWHVLSLGHLCLSGTLSLSLSSLCFAMLCFAKFVIKRLKDFFHFLFRKTHAKLTF